MKAELDDKIKRLKMKDLPDSERPYERLQKYGAHVLSNSELLAIIIKTGTKDETSVEMAQKLLKMDNESVGLSFLHNISLEQLKKVKGIGNVKAIQIKAVMELAKRISSTFNNERVVIKTPTDVSGHLMEEMRYLKQEELRTLLLNTKNCILKSCTIAIGGLNVSAVESREVFNEAIKAGSASIILVHNHPSGDPAPSKEDIAFTKRIAEGGEILGIKVLDHIIIGNGIFVSLKERGIF
jgi:DNA repair protein RadC